MERLHILLTIPPLIVLTAFWCLLLLTGLIPVWFCYTCKSIVRKGWEAVSPGITDGTILDLDAEE